MAVQYTGHMLQTETHDNKLHLILRIKILSIIRIKNENLSNSNNERSKPEFSGFFDIVVIRLVAYLFNSTNLIHNLTYIRFCIILTRFSINFSRTDSTLTGLDQLLKFSGFSLYPLSFFLYSPFKRVFYPIRHIFYYFYK